MNEGLFVFENFRILCFVGYWIFAFLTFYFVRIEDSEQASFSLKVMALFLFCYGVKTISEYPPIEQRKLINSTGVLFGNFGTASCLAGLVVLIIVYKRKR